MKCLKLSRCWSSFGLGPNELYTESVEAVLKILGPRGWDKGPSYSSGIANDQGGGESLLTIRKCWVHPHPSSMTDFKIFELLFLLFLIYQEPQKKQTHSKKVVDADVGLFGDWRSLILTSDTYLSTSVTDHAVRRRMWVDALLGFF